MREQVLLLANGNLNGRVLRLVADSLYRRGDHRVEVMSVTALNPTSAWPEERSAPHAVEPVVVDFAEAERRVAAASVFVLPPFWNESARRLVGVARRAGTPVVYVVADVGYGANKLETVDPACLPEWICVADSVSERLIIQRGIPARRIRKTGSPYLDDILADAPLPRPARDVFKVGLLASPSALPEQRSERYEASAEGVLPALQRVLQSLPASRLTIRLHPRQDPVQMRKAFQLSESTVLDPLPAASTMTEFIAAHDLIVGSFSTGLMAARLLGRPAVSFQPLDGDGIRREIFRAWDVPVVETEGALAAKVVESQHSVPEPLSPDRLFYEPGRSLDAIEAVILEALAHGDRPVRARTTETSSAVS